MKDTPSIKPTASGVKKWEDPTKTSNSSNNTSTSVQPVITFQMPQITQLPRMPNIQQNDDPKTSTTSTSTNTSTSSNNRMAIMMNVLL